MVSAIHRAKLSFFPSSKLGFNPRFEISGELQELEKLVI